MKTIREQHPEFLDYLSLNLDFPIPQECKTLALESQGHILAVVGFYNYTGEDIELSIAASSPRWFLSKQYLKDIFDYVFKTANCHRCTVRIEADNDRSIRVVERIGFTREGTLREANEGKDVHIYGLLKRDYYGQEISAEG